VLGTAAQNVAPERHQMSATRRARSASVKERGLSSGCGVRWRHGGVDGCVVRVDGGALAKAAGSRWSARSRRRGRTTLTPAPGGASSTSRTTLWVVSSRRETRGPHQVPSVGEGGQARLPRHLFAHVRAHGAVRPRPSGAQSHTSAPPACWEPCRYTSSPEGSCPSAHAATLSRRQRISPSRRP
jgi:hypothetical protein